MKRSYNSSNPPQGHTQSAPYQAAYAQPAVAAPPLPPGPPPPVPGQPAAVNPYANYGYGGGYDPSQPQQPQQPGAQVMAAHPQYPGYGYGQGAAAPAQQASPYAVAAPAAVDPNAAVAQQWAAYYAAYAQQAGAATAASAASPYAQPAQTAYAQPAAAAPYGAPPPPGGSPVGAPPHKRTRYDQPMPPPAAQQPPLPPGPPPPVPGGYGAPQQQPMPPSILPPVGGRSSRTGPPPPMGGRGPPPPRSDPYGAAGLPSAPGGMRGGRDMGPPARGGGGRGGPGMGMGMSGGMGGYDDRMMGPHGGGGGGGFPPRGAPMGPRGGGPRNDERYGGRGGPGGGGGGGRAMSGLPGGGGGGGNKYGAPSGPGGGGPRGIGLPNAPRGPKGALPPQGGGGGRNSEANRQAPRKERKWGSGAAGTASSPAPSKRDRNGDRDRDGERDRERETEGNKRTFTDFRIEGLRIPELEWEWNAERVELEMRKAAEELDKKVKEKEERDGADADAAAADALSDPTAIVKDEEVDGEPAVTEAENDDTGDMSIDQVPVSDLPPTAASEEPKPALPADPTATATISHGKHRRDEDAEAEPAPEGADDELEEGVKPKKVRVEVATSGTDGEEVALETLQPPAPPAEQAEPKAEEEEEREGALEVVKEEPKVEEPVHGEQQDDDEDLDGAPLPPSSQDAPPTAAEDKPAPAPPARENSRLRIYFSSPTTGTSSYTLPSAVAATKAPSSKAGSVPPPSIKEDGGSADGGKVEPATTPVDAAQLAKPVPPAEVMDKIEEEAQKEEAKGGEAVSQVREGTAPTDAQAAAQPVAAQIDDVDGEPVEDAPSAPSASEAPPAAQSAESAPAAADTVAVDGQDQPTAAVEPAVGTAGDDDDDDGELLITRAEPSEGAEQQQPEPARASSAAPSIAGTALLPPEPAADRISISYARNTRRMVLDADIIDSVKVHRGDGRIELAVRCEPAVIGEGEGQVDDEFRVCKGVLVESLDTDADDYVVMDRAALSHAWSTEADGSSPDALLPPLHRLLAAPAAPASTDTDEPAARSPFTHEVITVLAQLDRQNPLTEARWVKTGEVENWILSLGISGGANPKDLDRLSEWRNKIKIVDPDPPPTIQHALDSWATSSSVGTLDERKEFVKSRMSDIDNVVEILLRLTRGDRAGPSQYSSSSGYQQPPQVGALAVTLHAPFPDQQTQVSLAVLAMFRLSVATAQRAGIAAREVEAQVAEIVRALPSHLLFKSVDGMFREVVKGHKGGRGSSGRGGRGGDREGKKGRRD